MNSHDWAPVPFEALVEFHDRRRVPLSKKERADRSGAFPYYGAQGIIDWIDDYIFDGRFLLVAEDGENLNSRKQPIAYMAEGQFWVNNHAHVVKALEGLADDDFLRAYLEFHPLNGHVTGAAQPKLSQASLKRLPVIAPPFAVQTRIAEAIRALDGLLDNNRRRIEILEEMARLLYREWFVHFRFPGHEDVELVDSDLGPIPGGWGETCLAEELELQRCNIKPFDYADEEFEHYSIPAFDERRLPSRELGSEIRSGKYLLSGKSVMVSKLNPKFPRVWRVDRADHRRRAVASTEFLVMTDPGEWTLTFVYGLVTSPEFTAHLATTAGGTSTSHQRVKPTDVMNIPVICPPLEIVQRYSAQVEPLLKLADNLRDQVEVLRKARDLLLPRLVSGELDVSELDLGLVGA
ncbi:MAG: restriction endonuclease subunit S [Acidimicrobiaceae bacterium]|nr:restriction endonuclease subunit S [Acidimicrobiia bacterium]MCY4495530.1 restriction endonuclease subunit S [Acidimicrobiaceae bacterium]